jgi:hypothetical protein
VEALVVTVPSFETEREMLRGDVVGMCKTAVGGPSRGSRIPNNASARSLFRLVGLSKLPEIAGDSGFSWPWDCTEDCGVSKAGPTRGDSMESSTESRGAFAFAF